MRLAVISDIHLGDSQSTMAYCDANDNPCVGSRYGDFVQAVRAETGNKPLDYLILLGDILDFSVCSYTKAYSLGKFFFQKLAEDGVAKEFIYVPGNHDFDLWPTVEYQVNIINRLRDDKVPAPFKMSVPGIIDVRTPRSSPRRQLAGMGLVLRNVTAKEKAGLPKYGGLFLDNLTKPPITFNFAYPNLYLLTDEGTVLITHGQYLEQFWSLMGPWAMTVFGSALGLKDPNRRDLQETVALGFPLSQLGCAVLGQAGPLTNIVQQLEHEIKRNDLQHLSGYLDRFGVELRKHTTGLLKWTFPVLFRLAKNEILKQLKGIEDTRYSKEFLDHADVRQRLADFYDSTVYELEEIRSEYDVDIPLPTAMIFGHTHQPIAWGAPDAPAATLPSLKGNRLRMYNTGGWLASVNTAGQSEFCGAEVFFFSPDHGMTSRAIGYTR